MKKENAVKFVFSKLPIYLGLICGVMGFLLISFKLGWLYFSRKDYPEINLTAEETGNEVYRNYRQGLYACYRSLTSGYQGTYNTHKFLRGGQYNIYWTYYEPTKGNLTWNRPGALKAEIDGAKQTGLKTFLQIDAYGWDSEGALPKWLDNEIQVIDITGRDNKSEYIFWNRFPAPWDSAYHDRLKIFLNGLKNKLRQENAEKYIAGIEMGTGPMDQTSFSWSSIANELLNQSGTNSIDAFCQKYADGAKQVIDIYAEIFEDTDIPLILIGGSCYGTNKFDAIRKYAFSKYGLRIQYKMAGFGGWGTDASCGRRSEFKTICNVNNCPSDYLHQGDSCPASFCGQESGTSYNNWGCKDYASLFNAVIAEDNLSSTCLYSDDFSGGNMNNIGLIEDFAGRLGSKISFSQVNFPTSISLGGNHNLSIKWKNEGSTSLVWPQRVDNGDGTQRERSETYEIFLVFADRSDLRNTDKMYVQYVTPNPGTNTAFWKQKSVDINFKIDMPGLKEGNYNVYLGLSPKMSNLDKQIGKKSFGLALWNGGNWGRNDEAEGNNMYLIKENIDVSGNDNRQKLNLPFEGGNNSGPTPTPSGNSTPTPSSSPTPIPGSTPGPGGQECVDGNLFCYGKAENCSIQSCGEEVCVRIPQNLLTEARGWPEDQNYEAYKCCSDGGQVTPTPTTTPTTAPTATPELTPIPGVVILECNDLDNDCSRSRFECEEGLECYFAPGPKTYRCRNPRCLGKTNCVCDDEPTPTPTISPSPIPPTSTPDLSGERCFCSRMTELENNRIKVYKCGKSKLKENSRFAIFYNNQQVTSEIVFDKNRSYVFSLPRINGISIKCRDCSTSNQCGGWNEY